MYISSFNINSINARINNLINYLNNYSIDVLLLQEIKSVEENFPYKTFEDLGYNIYANCQKSYNGVAILRDAAQKLSVSKILRISIIKSFSQYQHAQF